MGKLALIGAVLLAGHAPAHHTCHYKLAITGGQNRAPIVLTITNTCDPPGGGFITRRIGAIGLSGPRLYRWPAMDNCTATTPDPAAPPRVTCVLRKAHWGATPPPPFVL